MPQFTQHVLTQLVFDNCVPRRQLDSCSVTRPFLSLRRVWGCETNLDCVLFVKPYIQNLPSLSFFSSLSSSLLGQTSYPRKFFLHRLLPSSVVDGRSQARNYSQTSCPCIAYNLSHVAVVPRLLPCRKT